VREQEGTGLQNGKSGDVTDNPVAGTTVFLYDSTNTLLGSTTTDASGAYSFSYLPGGTYKVSMAANLPMLTNTTLTSDNYYVAGGTGSEPAAVTGVTDNGTAAYLTVNVAANVSHADFAWVSTVDYDFGDLPSSYGMTTLAQDGARHIIPAGGATVYLGSVPPDAEPNGWPTRATTPATATRTRARG
jgi:hypothetical protein